VSFEVRLSTRAYKFFKKQPKNVYARLITKIEELADNPFPSGVRRVIGRKERLFRIRVGDYRILYEIFQDEKVILIVNIDKRSRVYE
jgi:mRNA interferase RelE/StbE